MHADLRRHSPAAERNRVHIAPHLLRWLQPQARPGRVLELASGSGQHAAFMAPQLPAWQWQPTDLEAANLASIQAWCEGLPGVLPPQRLDVQSSLPWAAAAGFWDAIYLANLLHISPWACTGALMRGAAHHLRPDGQLLIYGPFIEAAQPTAPSNLAFDADLRARDPAWGLRALPAVQTEAAAVGLRLAERVALPANNLLLRWVRG